MAESNPKFQEQRTGLAPIGLAVRKHGGQSDRLAPNIQSGTGVPSHTAPNGSLCLDDGDGYLYVRQEGAWVALATVATGASVDDDLSDQVDGVTDSFELSDPPVAASVRMYWNGQRQRRNVEFSVSGSTVTFTFTPPVGSAIEAEYIPA